MQLHLHGTSKIKGLQTILAEGQGFEPWGGCPPLVFKTSAFGRSATPPGRSQCRCQAG